MNLINTIVGYSLIAVGYLILGYMYGISDGVDISIICATLLSILMGTGGLFILSEGFKD